MTTRKVTLITAMAFIAALSVESFSAVAQTVAATGANSSFAGTWNGKRDDGAGLDLRIDEDGGKVSGSALLYFQVGGPLPLLAPHVEGKTLTFKIQHHKCTQCDELGPNARFLMELTGPNEASLWMMDDKGNRSGREVKLARRTDSPAWQDPSKHEVQFIIVEYNVRLEVLDWGGAGRSVVSSPAPEIPLTFLTTSLQNWLLSATFTASPGVDMESPAIRTRAIWSNV